MSVQRMALAITTSRLAKESAGHARLLRAIFTPDPDNIGAEIPPINPYSIWWNFVETDPGKWC